MPSYKIRPARPEDVDSLVEIERLAFDADRYGGMLMTRRSFAGHIARGTNALLVAVDEATGTVAGYSLGFVKRTSPYIRFYSIAVRPDHEGRGAGRLLFAAIEEEAKRRGLRGVRLEIRADNTRLFARYQRGGYRVFAEVPDYYPDGVGAIRMVREVGD